MKKSPKPRPRGRPKTTGSRGWPSLTVRVPAAVLADLRRTAAVTASTLAQVVIDACEGHCREMLELHDHIKGASDVRK